MIKNFLMKNNAFTMVEIIVSSLILALTIAGLLSTIQSLNRPAVESFEEVQAAYLGKQVIEDLKDSISALSWDEEASLLKPDETFQGPVIFKDGVTYNAVYDVRTDPGQAGRWVTVTVQWQ